MTTLVVCGTGKTGRRVVEQLTARGLPVRIGSRSAEPPFDWEDADTWIPALAGVEAAYVTYYPDLAVPGAPDTVRDLATLAVEVGVRRLVFLSGRGEEGALLAEQGMRASGADWTIVRSAWFNQNFSEGLFLDQVLSGEVALPAGDVKEPFADADDIADVAVAALTESGHVGQLYEVTGPRLLTFAEAVGEISRAAGRHVTYLQVSMEHYEASLAQHALPSDAIQLVKYLFNEVLDGRNARLGDGVQRALHRAPRDFVGYARRAAAHGVWGEIPAREV
jgi:uncharacterized protein YbjT (DUF2867 family)